MIPSVAAFAPRPMFTARSQNAYVDIPTSAITINRSGTGTGSITATGLSCPGGSTTQAVPCGASYATGSVVTFTAVPDAGSTFAGWGGGCYSGTTNPVCPVTLAGDRYAFAQFEKIPTTVTTNYYHTDVIDSVRAITDQAGATVIRHDYLPFGEVFGEGMPTGDPMRFGGKELDPESALMNFEARYYRNTWGRFTQVDPMGGSLGDTQSWNRYAYARNNPLRFVDPTGMEFRSGVDCAAGGDGTSACPWAPIDTPDHGSAGGSSDGSGLGSSDVQLFTHQNNPQLVGEGFCGSGANNILYMTWACPADTAMWTAQPSWNATVGQKGTDDKKSTDDKKQEDRPPCVDRFCEEIRAVYDQTEPLTHPQVYGEWMIFNLAGALAADVRGAWETGRITFDGPSGTRLIQVKVDGYPFARLDYGPVHGSSPQLHLHLDPFFGDWHIPLDPRKWW